MIYLDYAAATPMDKKVLHAMEPYFSDKFFNPSAAYTAARDVRVDYQNAKHKLASLIGAKPAEIVITAGATESINLALSGVDGEIITTETEHPAVLETARARSAKIIPVDEFGRIKLDKLQQAINDKTELISVAYANNEIGTVQSIKEIAEIVAQIRRERIKEGNKRPLLFHTDASQAAGQLDINVARLDVDLLTLNAGKCYGPKQVGLLYIRAGVVLKPYLFGGGQEMGLRSGTENIAGTIGFAEALSLVESRRKNEAKRLGELKNSLQKFIQNEFPSAVFNGHKKHALPSILNFSIPGLDAERAVFALDQKGILVATGSACAANKDKRSHVLLAIGLSPELADASLRLSFGRHNTLEEIEAIKPILSETIKEQLKFGGANNETTF